jgi:hypothetical protein
MFFIATHPNEEIHIFDFMRFTTTKLLIANLIILHYWKQNIATKLIHLYFLTKKQVYLQCHTQQANTPAITQILKN